MIVWGRHSFHPVLHLPDDAVVLDLTGPIPEEPPTPWRIGRYDELRPMIYTQSLFAEGDVRRSLHVGIDLGGPVGEPVHAFADGCVLHQGHNPAEGDYGHVIVTEHELDGVKLYALFGHLSARSLGLRMPGEAFSAGSVLGFLGDRHENGGWPSHVHLQLAWARPVTHDMPGAVDPAERAAALGAHPDPRLVLGPVY
jgi:murein DD-endopeptidase MepM/ murein hydrolase activator NlpD